MDKIKNKYEFKQSAENTDVLDLYIYGEVCEGYDWWTDEYGETSSHHFKEQLQQYSNVSNINVYINSVGGSVLEGMAIRNMLSRHPANVTAIVDGFACSIASFILTGCDTVKMYSNSMQMIHNAWQFAMGNAEALRKKADDLDKIMEGNRQAYLEKSDGKITEDKLKELLDAETWLTAQDCLQYGLCDEIIGTEIDLSKAQQLMQKVNMNIQQQINYNVALKQQLKQQFEPKINKEPPKDPLGASATEGSLTLLQKLKNRSVK